MELQFSTKQMASAIKSVKKIFDKSEFGSDPSAEDCLIASASDGNATIESAASGLYVKVTVPAEVKDPGDVMINRATLHNMKFSGERTAFTHKPKSNVLKFISGPMNGELSVNESVNAMTEARPQNLPNLTMSIASWALKAAAKRTCIPSTLDEILRMHLIFKDDVLTLSSNDSFRASAVRANLTEDDGDGAGEIEVPSVFFNTVVQAIDSETIQIGFNSSLFRIAGGAFDICHPIMQEAEKPPVDVFAKFEHFKSEAPVDVFAKFEHFKSEAPAVSAVIDATPLQEAINSVVSVAPSGLGGDMRLDLMFSEKGGGLLTVAVKSATGMAKYKVALGSVEIARRVPIAISARYLLEMLNMMATDQVCFYAWDRVIVLQGEQVGCCMILPQLSHVEDDED